MKCRKPTTQEWDQAMNRYGLLVPVQQCVQAKKFGKVIIHPPEETKIFCSYCKPRNYKGELADFPKEKVTV